MNQNPEDGLEKNNALLRKKVAKLEGEISDIKAKRESKLRRAGRRLVDGKVSYQLTEAEISSLNYRNAGLDPEANFVIDPPESRTIQKEGSWAMIIRQLPAIEQGFDKKVRVGMMFWCKHQDDTDEKGFARDGTYKVICQTPWGQVHLWPYEFSRIATSAIFSMWDEREIVFHPIAENLRFTDALFYLRSRGIGIEEAMVMCLGTFQGAVGWFEPVPELLEACQKMERRVHDWKPWKPRRTLKDPMAVTIRLASTAEEGG